MKDELYKYEELVELYNEMIDELEGDVVVCGMSYPASRVLRECDPIAWRVGFHDWLSDEFEELEDLPDIFQRREL